MTVVVAPDMAHLYDMRDVHFDHLAGDRSKAAKIAAAQSPFTQSPLREGMTQRIEGQRDIVIVSHNQAAFGSAESQAESLARIQPVVVDRGSHHDRSESLLGGRAKCELRSVDIAASEKMQAGGGHSCAVAVANKADPDVRAEGGPRDRQDRCC